MINSRDINELHPRVRDMAQKMIDLCAAEGIDIILTSTYRDHASQEWLFAQGRTRPGNRVTNARGGQSFHNYRVAFDVVPVVNGKAVWNDTRLWQRIGAIGESVGLEWAWRWRTFKEMPHFQYTGGLTLAQLQAGATLA